MAPYAVLAVCIYECVGRIKEYIYGVLPGHLFIKELFSSKRAVFE